MERLKLREWRGWLPLTDSQGHWNAVVEECKDGKWKWTYRGHGRLIADRGVCDTQDEAIAECRALWERQHGR